LAAVLCGVLLGCSEEPPDKLLASAKSYLARNDRAAAIIQLKGALQQSPDLGEARYLLGKTLLENEDATGAAVELRKAHELNHSPDQVVPLLAKALLGSGDARKVIELDGATTLTAPEAVADFKTTVALAQAVAGNSDKVDAAIEAALRAKPDHAPARLYKAVTLATAKKYDAASEIVDDVLAKTPNDHDALALKGDLLRSSRNDDAGATDLYRKALASKPNDLPAFAALTDQLLAKGDLAGARAQVEAMKKLRPRHPQTVFYDARIAAQQGDLKAADELMQQVLKVAPENPRYLQLAGTVALKQNRLLVAEGHFGKLVKLTPQSPVPRQLLAQTLLRHGEPAKALEVLEPVLQSAAPDARSLAVAGGASLVSGDLKKAATYFGRAAKADPTDTHSRTGFALARVLGGDPAGGLSDLQAISGDDRSTVTDMALVTTYFNRRDFNSALKAIDQFEKKAPGKPQAPHLRALALAARGDLKGARANYEKALAADPDYYPSIDGLAALDLREKKPAAARARFEAVLKARPGDARAMVGLAKLDELAGKPKPEVAATLAKAVDANPADPFLRRRLVMYHLGKHDYKLALNAAQNAVSALPNDPDMLALLGNAQLAAGESNQAISSYGKLVSMQPRSPLPLLGLANAQIAAKSYAAAAEAVNKAATFAPDSPAVVQLGAQIDLLTGKPDAALAKARALQARLPKAAFGFSIEGDIEATRRNWGAAAAAFRAALQRDPEATSLAQGLYRALRGSGDRVKADALAADWMKQHPADASFPFLLASLSIADHKYELAEGQLRQVLRLDPDNALVLNNLAWVLSAQKKPQALETAERANQLAPNQPMYMDTLAKVLSEQGQVPRALQVQKKAVELDPDAGGLRLTLARLYVQSGDKAAARTELDALAKLGDKFPQQGEVRDLLAQL
jgi:putative PEP-CTERM system TPR-repeat lipoprotein